MLCWIPVFPSNWTLHNLGYFIYVVTHRDTYSGSNSTLIHLNGSPVNNNTTLEILILTTMLMAQIYIAKVVTRFYNLLPCDIDRDRVTYTCALTRWQRRKTQFNSSKRCHFIFCNEWKIILKIHFNLTTKICALNKITKIL